MSTIRVSDLRVETAADSAVLSARLDARRLGWRGERLWFRIPRDLAPRHAHGDPFAAGLLIGAMAGGLDLVIEGPLSPSFAANLSRIQELLLKLNAVNPWTRVHAIAVRPSSLEPARNGPARAGLFFSGGVDSMYSLLSAEYADGRPPDVLLFVLGYDVPLGRPGRAETVLHHVSAAAAMAGRPLAVLRTNLRHFTDAMVSWDLNHGGGLAAAGHAAGGYADRWYISASDSHYRNGELSGTTTPLDPLWSRDGLAFMSVGGSLDRQMKTAAVAEHRCAREHLVVCWKAPAGITNCGRCAKCLRTMLQLLVVDALDRFDTLPRSLPAELLTPSALPPEPYRVVHWQALLERLSARCEWAPLAKQVEAMIDRSERIKRGPRLRDLATEEGRIIARTWLRRTAIRRMPVSIRRRLLSLEKRLRRRVSAR